MENSNSREYLEKITSAVIDNLRQTGPAPSVQMQDVPRKPFGGMTDEEEAELDDLDEDEHKDERMTEHRWDKRVENGAEFEPSDDEDMAGANGATRKNGNKRTFTDYRKDTEEPAGKESGPIEAGEKASDENTLDDAQNPDDTIEDITAADETEKEPAKDKGQEETKAPEAAKVDGDGDVGMADSANTEEPATIKQEEGEPEAVPEPSSNEKDSESKEPEVSTDAPAEKKEAAAEDSVADATTEKVADAPEEAAKTDEAADAMDVDTEKSKDGASKEAAASS